MYRLDVVDERAEVSGAVSLMGAGVELGRGSEMGREKRGVSI